MKIKPITFLVLIPLAGVLMFSSSCKKDEVTKTIIQQDTIIQHDTVFVNYSYIEYFNSGDNSELFPSLPIQLTSSWNQGRVIYTVHIPNLKTGDVISANAECEVTLDSSINYSPSFFSQIILAPDSLTKPDATSLIQEISEANGMYITSPIHHWTINQTGTYQCTSNLGDKYVNFCAHAEHSSAGVGDTLGVPQDYGRLSIIVYRK